MRSSVVAAFAAPLVFVLTAQPLVAQNAAWTLIPIEGMGANAGKLVGKVTVFHAAGWHVDATPIAMPRPGGKIYEGTKANKTTVPAAGTGGFKTSWDITIGDGAGKLPNAPFDAWVIALLSPTHPNPIDDPNRLRINAPIEQTMIAAGVGMPPDLGLVLLTDPPQQKVKISAGGSYAVAKFFHATNNPNGYKLLTLRVYTMPATSGPVTATVVPAANIHKASVDPEGSGTFDPVDIPRLPGAYKVIVLMMVTKNNETAGPLLGSVWKTATVDP